MLRCIRCMYTCVCVASRRRWEIVIRSHRQPNHRMTPFVVPNYHYCCHRSLFARLKTLASHIRKIAWRSITFSRYIEYDTQCVSNITLPLWSSRVECCARGLAEILYYRIVRWGRVSECGFCCCHTGFHIKQTFINQSSLTHTHSSSSSSTQPSCIFVIIIIMMVVAFRSFNSSRFPGNFNGNFLDATHNIVALPSTCCIHEYD